MFLRLSCESPVLYIWADPPPPLILNPRRPFQESSKKKKMNFLPPRVNSCSFSLISSGILATCFKSPQSVSEDPRSVFSKASVTCLRSPSSVFQMSLQCVSVDLHNAFSKVPTAGFRESQQRFSENLACFRRLRNVFLSPNPPTCFWGPRSMFQGTVQRFWEVFAICPSLLPHSAFPGPLTVCFQEVPAVSFRVSKLSTMFFRVMTVKVLGAPAVKLRGGWVCM